MHTYMYVKSAFVPLRGGRGVLNIHIYEIRLFICYCPVFVKMKLHKVSGTAGLAEML